MTKAPTIMLRGLVNWPRSWSQGRAFLILVVAAVFPVARDLCNAGLAVIGDRILVFRVLLELDAGDGVVTPAE
jgi:hypothetical protein